METGRTKTQPVILDETPEQTAQGRLESLEFLRRESLSIGMTDVAELIVQARRKAKPYCRAH